MALLSPCGHCGNEHDSSVGCTYPDIPKQPSLEDRLAALETENAKLKKGKKDA